MINIIIIDADKKRNLALLTALSTMDQRKFRKFRVSRHVKTYSKLIPNVTDSY